MLRPISDRLRFGRDCPGDGPEYRDCSSSFPDLCSILDPSSHQYQREAAALQSGFLSLSEPADLWQRRGFRLPTLSRGRRRTPGQQFRRPVSPQSFHHYSLGWRCRPWHANRNSRREQLKSTGQLNPQRWQLLKKPYAKFWRAPTPKTTEILAVSTSE
ncbi:hypothetical protein ZIOFF_059107 [Zingiber officinale]|uniref:Uncharacterized protein n=1 Tax=Zingiber officinale TaxID=94328 RepID=A0A8J5KFH0_ZINOF|nr:hypothetical protein ZIOFF_059107 [Zingiber officinale]